ncbi:e3 sumo-protein ligase nse2 [Plasmopara halstedii]|uniref:E3 sumo-protein ligase nse2 n=1 Tax=Plasmopara halstedii TaxID=4781 RepID=A0A0P1AT64_PLAHL|nr:e3 sumo-protein ligase nse2 [Plasmopara halstedii]CEG44416.1 e3 sumo-protein ligase nse2 [Plasmopara halstedii]|eukprot:XP_024580785.1 e3 sumo-protein ligase nse2 [Plasmopara halstedii]
MDTELEANIKQALPSALKMALYAAKKQHLEILKYAIEGVDSLCNNAAFLKDLDDQEHLQQLGETAKGFALLETQLTRYKTQLEKLEPFVETGKLDQTKINNVLKSALAKPRINATKHDFYKKFCDKAGIERAVDGDEDVLVQESESTRSTICPVTQMEMDDPLRNPSCGHTYSKKGIQAHLQRSKKCPVAGCPQELLLNNLERDVEMEVIIARRLSRHASEQQWSHDAVAMADEDEEDEEEYVVE